SFPMTSLHSRHHTHGGLEEQDHGDGGGHGESGGDGEQGRNGHGSVERSHSAAQVIAGAGGDEPETHHHADYAGGRQLGHGAQSDGAERQLAERVKEVSADQPEGRDCLAAGNGNQQDESGADEEQAESELSRARRLALAQPDPEPGEHGGERNDEEGLNQLIPTRRELVSVDPAV